MLPRVKPNLPKEEDVLTPTVTYLGPAHSPARKRTHRPEQTVSPAPKAKPRLRSVRLRHAAPGTPVDDRKRPRRVVGGRGSVHPAASRLGPPHQHQPQTRRTDRQRRLITINMRGTDTSISSWRRGAVATAIACFALFAAPGIALASSPATASHAQLGPDGLVRASRSLAAYWSVHAPSARPLTVTLTGTPTVGGTAARPQGPAVRISGVAGSAITTGHDAMFTAGATGSGWYGSSSSPPATTTGKVFFTDHTGGTWRCSGSLVNSPGKDLVITAGHCVYGTNGGQLPAGETWHSNWVFAPDYSNGSAPFGYWTARQLSTLTNYIKNGDRQDDLGAAILNSNSSGTKAVNLLGGQGYAWNEPTSQYIYDFGYPAAYPFNGQTLQYCNGSDSSSPSIAMELLLCNFTVGSSGGPWLMSFNGVFGSVNSVNDATYSQYPGYVAGLYFGNNAANLYNSVKYL
jgi:V8-like Glu-specific endopeptidase